MLGLGFTIVTRRYRARHGEIDLIAFDGDTLVAVEVKSTQSLTRDPIEAIDRTKKERIGIALRRYLSDNGLDCRCRYDVVAVSPIGLTHHRDVWHEIE